MGDGTIDNFHGKKLDQINIDIAVGEDIKKESETYDISESEPENCAE